MVFGTCARWLKGIYMTWDPQLVASVLISAGSATLQAAGGFAAGLMGIPMLLWAGNSLPQAQIMFITAMLPQNAYSLWKLREHNSFQEVAWPAIIRLAFLPIGIWGLAWLDTNSSSSIKPLVGSTLVAWPTICSQASAQFPFCHILV